MKAYIGAISQDLLDNVEHAERSDFPILLSSMEDPQKQQARTLSYILAQTLTSSALQLVRNIEVCDGLETWRQLVRKSPWAAQRRFPSLDAFSIRNSRAWEEETQRMQSAVLLYESTHNEILPDSLRQALLKSNAPQELRRQLELATFPTVKELRETISGFVVNQSMSKGASSLSSGAMDIDYIGKGKGKFDWSKGAWSKGGKGKGDPKGKGKGDSKGKGAGKGLKGPGKDAGKGQQHHQQKFEGWCNTCGKWGHKSKDCWHSNQRHVSNVANSNQLPVPPGGPGLAPPPGMTGLATAPSLASTTSVSGHVAHVMYQPPAEEDTTGWIFMVGDSCSTSPEVALISDKLGGAELLLLDSGAFTHVCSKEYAPVWPIKYSRSNVQLKSVTGKVLQVYGENLVRFRLWASRGDSLDVQLTFCCMRCSARDCLHYGTLEQGLYRGRRPQSVLYRERRSASSILSVAGDVSLAGGARVAIGACVWTNLEYRRARHGNGGQWIIGTSRWACTSG